jgi:hypothetical protein
MVRELLGPLTRGAPSTGGSRSLHPGCAQPPLSPLYGSGPCWGG